MKQTGFTNVKIQETLNKSKFFVGKWLKRYKKVSDLQDEKGSGRPKKVKKSLEGRIKR